MGQFVDFATTVFTTNCCQSSSSSEQALLVIIISNGQVMSEGPDQVKQAVRRAQQMATLWSLSLWTTLKAR